MTVTGYGLFDSYWIWAVCELLDMGCVGVTGYGLCESYWIWAVWELLDMGCVTVTGYGLCVQLLDMGYVVIGRAHV
jgi:hypothetical protein